MAIQCCVKRKKDNSVEIKRNNKSKSENYKYKEGFFYYSILIIDNYNSNTI